MPRKWTKEEVVEAIQARHRQGLPLVGIYDADPRLYSRAYRLFGSWHDALLAAGQKPRLRRWNKQRVLDAIRARQQQGLPISGITQRDPGLYQAGCRHFGSWQRAMLAAGLSWKLRTRWTPEVVIAAIRVRSRQGLPLSSVTKDAPRLVQAAGQHFGSWYEALVAAGITDVSPRKWDEARFLAAFEALRRQGIPLTTRRVPSALYQAACRHFGSWHDALDALGYAAPCPRPQKWTTDKVLEEIRLRHRQGASMISAANGGLARAAARRFGSWRDALEAAGLKTARRQKKWSKQRVLEELRIWQEQHAFDESTWIEDRGLVSAAARHFGSWRCALVTAGILAPEEKRRCRKRWTAHRVIEVIQDRYVRGLPLIADGDKTLATAARGRFGSWHAALLAAGLDVGEKPKPRRRWTRQAVIDELTAARKRGSTPGSIRKNNSGLVNAARRHFGSWHDALVAAGMAAPEARPRRPERWSKRRIIDEIRVRHRQSASLNSNHPSNRFLAAAAMRHFGGWRRALLAAGIPRAPQPYQRWDRSRVIAALRQQAQRNGPLRKAHVDKALASVVYRYLGSWHAALTAAGLVGTEEE